LSIYSFVFFLLNIPAFSQNGIEGLHYDIQVRLDTSDHSLKASQTVQFTNATDKKLDVVYFHLWANAYQDNYSPLVQQQLRMNNTSLHFAHKLNRGGYKAIQFSETETGNVLEVKYQDDSKEIAEIFLTKGLAAGEEISIRVEYEIKIPRLYSRFGRRKNYYQITQWYPKLAKFEDGIWHTMPYLDIGEFYSDFANYNVSIDAPVGYEIASTGVENSKGKYSANKVIDFAWFCSPKFKLASKQVAINSKVIELQVYNYNSNPLFDNAMEFLERSLRFYSEEVGDYPYTTMTLVLSEYAKGGMEYPSITVIGAKDEESLDHLVAHEVGHNWFYAALASNERKHAWMDEGLNSFYDHKYHLKYYNDAPYNNLVPSYLRNAHAYNILEAGFRGQEVLRKHQASNLSSELYSPLNYGIAAYQKPAVGYAFLESYLGKKKFKQIVQSYYAKYAHTNVKPEELQAEFESGANENLDWFFKDYIGSESQIDISVNNIENANGGCQVEIENKSSIDAPVQLSLLKENAVVDSMWVAGFSGKKTVALDQCDFEQVILFNEIINPDINGTNNSLKKSGLFKKGQSTNFKLLGGIQSRNKRDLFYFPHAAFNAYDKLMLGVGFYNSSFPPKGFRFAFAPAYSFNAKQLVGFGLLEKDLLFDSERFRKGIASFGFKRYNYFDNGYQLHYAKFTPELRFYFKTDPLVKTTKSLSLRVINLIEEYPIFNEESVSFDETYSLYSELKYSSNGQDVLAPVNFSASLEYGNYDGFSGARENFLKISSEYAYAYQFVKSKFFKFRLFGGYFLMNSQRESGSMASRFARGSFSLMSQGFTDYKYDETYLGRTNQTGVESRQISLTDGGFKDSPGSSYRIGLSNDYALAMNVKTDFPFDVKIPIKLYFDMGAVSTKSTAVQELKSKAYYSGGLAFEFLDETIGIYLPLVQSTEISDSYLDRTFLQKISFTVNTRKFNFWRAMEETSF